MNDIVQFSRNIRKRGRQVVNSGSEATRRAAKSALTSLVLATKADTGRARSNWRVGIGAPTSAEIEPYSPYRKGSKANGQGMGETANAFAAIAAGTARINSVKGVSGVGLKTAIFVSNNIAYLDKAMTSGGFEASLLEAQASIRGFKIFDRNGED